MTDVERATEKTTAMPTDDQVSSRETRDSSDHFPVGCSLVWPRGTLTYLNVLAKWIGRFIPVKVEKVDIFDSALEEVFKDLVLSEEKTSE